MVLKLLYEKQIDIILIFQIAYILWYFSFSNIQNNKGIIVVIFKMNIPTWKQTLFMKKCIKKGWKIEKENSLGG